MVAANTQTHGTAEMQCVLVEDGTGQWLTAELPSYPFSPVAANLTSHSTHSYLHSATLHTPLSQYPVTQYVE